MSKAEIKTGLRQVAPAALRFDAASAVAFKFAAAGDAAPVDGEAIPVTLTARTAEPVEHWLFGAVVHDFAGMTHGERIPVDYCHETRDILGYLDQFTVDAAGLTVAGFVIPFGADKGAEVASKAKRGVPYQASIDFADRAALEMEEYGEGQVAEANGRQYIGPVLVVRKWRLRAVAICPHGLDSRTAAQFSADDKSNETVAVKVTKHEVQTMQLTDEEKAQFKADARKEALADMQKEQAQFTSAFGPDGLAYFTAGKSFVAATTEHVAKLTASVKTERDRADAAEKKCLAFAAKFGDAAVDPGAAPDDKDAKARKEADDKAKQADKAKQYTGKASDGVAQFASSLNLPPGIAK